MAERTNLIATDNPVKYILGSVLLLGISGIGIFWIFQNKKTPEVVKAEISVTPTIIVEKDETASVSALAITPTVALTATLTASKTASISAIPTLKLIETYQNVDDGFSVRYDGKRKLAVENEASGKRYIFYSYSGNITVHTGNAWSWINSGRTFSETLLVGGEKSYIYEISNQKIVDIEKGNKKYTIQCVHNGQKELKNECQKFLEDFNFI